MTSIHELKTKIYCYLIFFSKKQKVIWYKKLWDIAEPTIMGVVSITVRLKSSTFTLNEDDYIGEFIKKSSY